jgi:chorismate synthase
VPPGLPLTVEDFLPDLARRRPGQSRIVTQRNEADEPEILSGVFEGQTTGTSLAILIRNQDQRSRDYGDIQDKYRPGHADFSLDAKYGIRDYRGGGRSSARETNVRVAAGERMVALVDEMRKAGDSIGGAAEIVAKNVPAGLGEPVFDKLKADLAKALFTLPAVLGVEYGIGFGCATMRGSDNNDAFIPEAGGAPNRNGIPAIATASNRHGGMLGGISTGQPIVLRAAVKPTSSLPIEQRTVTRDGEPTTIRTKGRHDPCLLPRFVPIAEAMVAIVLADHWLRWQAQCSGSWK